MHIKVKTSKSVEFDTFRTPMHGEISAMPPTSSSSSSCLIWKTSMQNSSRQAYLQLNA